MERSLATLLSLAAIALAAACGQSAPPSPAAGAGGWHEFEGSWNAAGSRRVLDMGEGRRAAIVELRGSMLLSGAGCPGIGFRSELIGLTDRNVGLVGRSVWTDERGDQVFSELTGQGTAANNRISGTFVGGTGRYAGATGTYEFSWQYVMEAEDGSIQGRAAGLKGRVQVGGPAAGGKKP